MNPWGIIRRLFDGGRMLGERGDLDDHVGEERKPGEQRVQFIVVGNVENRVVGVFAHHAPQMLPAAIPLESLAVLAFLSLDAGEAKAALVKWLHARGVGFVDIGMGLELGEQGLSGILRVTTSTLESRTKASPHNRIPLAGGGAGDIYASNIQVADLNALNAVLAVIKWKKLCGFYCDLEREHHSTYTLDGNMLLNEDQS